jgi:hypothetical protein
MDFKALMRPVRFGKGLPAADVPAPLVRKDPGNRRLAALREAADLLTVLPQPGESLHAIQSGRFDLCDALDVLLARLGPATCLRIATLSFNGRNVQRMKAWLQTGAVQRLTLLCPLFFVEHNPDLFQQVGQALRQPHRLAASRNHAKVICVAFATGNTLALEGSANLRSNGNREQFAVFTDPGVHAYHAAWIDEEVRRHESDPSRSAPTG